MKKAKSLKDLYVLLAMLTSLFVGGQLLFFITHYKVAGLIDSLADSEIIAQIFHPVILLPIVIFIALQLIAYFLFVAWTCFVSVGMGRLFNLTTLQIYWLGIAVWMGAIFSILFLNYFFYPSSFFAKPLHAFLLSKRVEFSVGLGIFIVFLILNLLAYISFFYQKSQRVLGSLFLLLAFFACAISYYDARTFFAKQNLAGQKPNIILIGLDSLRPDFTNTFGARNIHTPTMDHFLQTGVSFANAYTPLARTYPAWMSILTSDYPKENLARTNLAVSKKILEQDNLAKALQKAGYETVYASDEKRFSNITREYGFDKIIGPSMGINDFLLGGLSDFPLTNLLINLPWGAYLFPFNYGNRAADVTYEPNAFLRLLKIGLRAGEAKPFFLVIHLCLAHWPYTWANGALPDQSLAQNYLNSVEAVDKQLGEVLNLLKASGLLNHSLVGLLSDHGVALGMPGDRLLIAQNYRGDKKDLKLLSLFKVSDRNQAISKENYVLNTAFGQGTDILSDKQYRVLLSFKGYGLSLPKKQVPHLVSLLDVAPTILDYLQLPPLKESKGHALTPFFGHSTLLIPKTSVLFLETADSSSEIETDHIQVEKVIKQRMSAYEINLSNGLLHLNPAVYASIIKNKQRAVLMDHWLLASYPAKERLALSKSSANGRSTLKPILYPPYFVLMNLKTGEWSIGFSSRFAQSAPVTLLLRKLNQFYGTEIPPLVQSTKLR